VKENLTGEVKELKILGENNSTDSRRERLQSLSNYLQTHHAPGVGQR
jgi:hypothetical protein